MKEHRIVILLTKAKRYVNTFFYQDGRKPRGLNSALIGVIKREVLLVAAALGCGLLLTLFLVLSSRNYAFAEQKKIAEQVIRFHILANSDEAYDQELKFLVKEAVQSYLEPQMKESKSLEETRGIILDEMENIKAIAQMTVNRAGYSYPVEAALESASFPTRTYGDISLPAGTYEALRIRLGSAAGKNWWCVVFPPLCYVDITKPTLPEDSKALFEEIMREEEMDILYSKSKEKLSPKIKFKIIELWQGLAAKP